jgi:hypothetical protein
MKVLAVTRKYLTRDELLERWGLRTDLDLRRLVMDGTLRMCVMRQEELTPAEVVNGMVRPLAAGPEAVRGWLYPQFPVQFLPFDCAYGVVSDMSTPVEGCSLWALPQPITLTQLLAEGVAMLDDVLDAEAATKLDPDRQLSAREEKTRDRLLTVLAAEHLGWTPWEDGRDLKLADLLNAAKAYGVPLSRNAAKDHLRLAWERVKPAV